MSEKTNIPKTTIIRRHKQVIEKLKKYLETLVNGDPFRLKNLEDL